MFQHVATSSHAVERAAHLALSALLMFFLAACGGGTGDSTQAAALQDLGTLQITTESVPAGSPGIAYDDTQLTAAGAVGPVSWSVAGGELPPGLRLTDDGRVVGTPVAPGFFEFTTKACDGVQEDARTLAIAVGVFGLSVVEGVRFGEAWSGRPVSLRAAGAAGGVRFEAVESGSHGRFSALDAQGGRATWVPGPVGIAGSVDRLRAVDVAGGEVVELELPVFPDPTESHVARFGASDVWVLDFNARSGVHPYASDFHAGLVRLGLRAAESTLALGREVDQLADLVVRLEVLRELNTMYLRERDGSEGARGLAISFPLERPGAGYSAPRAGESRAARPDGYSVMSVCEQDANRGAYGVAFVDRLGNPNQENDAPGGPAGDMGVFVNVVSETVARTYRLYGSEFAEQPIAATDRDALLALLHDRPGSGGRYDAVAYQVRAFAHSLACIAAHEIAHSLGAPHLETYVTGGIMNGVGVIGPGLDYYFVPSTLDVLRAGLGGGPATGASTGIAALGVGEGVHVCGGACQGE